MRITCGHLRVRIKIRVMFYLAKQNRHVTKHPPRQVNTGSQLHGMPAIRSRPNPRSPTVISSIQFAEVIVDFTSVTCIKEIKRGFSLVVFPFRATCSIEFASTKTDLKLSIRSPGVGCFFIELLAKSPTPSNDRGNFFFFTLSVLSFGFIQVDPWSPAAGSFIPLWDMGSAREVDSFWRSTSSLESS